jgi:nucleotide-binding universal stress UspA family protein
MKAAARSDECRRLNRANGVGNIGPGSHPVSIPPLARVLVATDLSPSGKRAVERAAALPLAAGADLEVLYVCEGGAEEAGVARAGLERLAASATRALARSGHTARVRSRVSRGSPVWREIVRQAEERGSELVVLGRRGGGGFRRLLLGSTAERVVRGSTVPVLVVGSGEVRPYARPLVAVDLTADAARTLAMALRVRDPGSGALDVLHAFDVPFETRLGLAMDREAVLRFRRRFAREARAGLARVVARARRGSRPRQWSVTVREGDARGVILAQAARRRARLIAVGREGPRGILRGLLGSVADAVVRYAECDVLVVVAPVRRTPPQDLR